MSVLIHTHSITYFQFQFPILSIDCVLSLCNLRQKGTSQHRVNVNEWSTKAVQEHADSEYVDII